MRARESYDLIVIGGGHAGCEAAHASARLGLSTLLVTLRLGTIARMSCNPSIGGPAKGNLTREIDALGGIQGEVTDATYVSLRMLNTGKGPAVQALRAQVDRRRYSVEMRLRLTQTPHLDLLEGETLPPAPKRQVHQHRRSPQQRRIAQVGVLEVIIGGGAHTDVSSRIIDHRSSLQVEGELARFSRRGHDDERFLSGSYT